MADQQAPGAMHSHGPGQPMHSHGPAQPQVQAQVQAQVLPKPDERIQASIDAQYIGIDFQVGGPSECSVLCTGHGQEKCDVCGVDFVDVNRLSRLFTANPHIAFPPPPNLIPPQMTQQLTAVVNKLKEEGNTFLKAKQIPQALQRYSMAINAAAQRPPWEPQQHLREELATSLSNRAAAFATLGDHLSSLIDAEAVIQLKRPWSKGHYRKAKALVGLGELEDARIALLLGLQYEPTNEEMNTFYKEIEDSIKAKAANHVQIDEKPAVVAATA